MTGLIQHHHGRVVDATGDNLMAEFASVVDAVESSVEIQKELKTRNAELPRIAEWKSDRFLAFKGPKSPPQHTGLIPY